MTARVKTRAPQPLAFMRLNEISAERIDRAARYLRACKDPMAKEVLAVFNDMASHWVTATNELGQLYQERKRHAA